MLVGDLFSGIGGFSLGLQRAGMQTAFFCEQDKFCKKVLKKHWPEVPIYSDVRYLHYGGSVDVICGGFPCQPYSITGEQRGEADDRDLWPEMFRIVRKHRPRWVIGENVPGFINLGLDKALSNLESEGYTTATFIVPACAVNAPHRRDRLWIVANAHGHRLQGRAFKGQNAWQQLEKQLAGLPKPDVWGERPNYLPKPVLCRGDDGLSRRVDRLKALGNAIVPHIAEIFGKMIMLTEGKAYGVAR